MKKFVNALWKAPFLTLSFVVLILLFSCSSPTGPGGGLTPPDPELPQVPGIPQNIEVHNDANGNSTLSWSSVTGAKAYKVYHSGAEAGDYAAISSMTGISYLLPFYGWYKVSATNDTGEGALSSGIERKEPVLTSDRVDTPTLSIAPGSFDETTNVELSCTTPDALIYYTTDGSTPIVGASNLFTSAIIVVPGETITITAIAAATGFANSDAASGTYHVRSWEVVGSAGFSGGEVNDLSLAIDASGRPSVSFRDNAAADKATVMRFNGTSWSALGGAGISSMRAFYTNLATDATGALYLSYFDEAVGGKATVRKFDGTSWPAIGAPGFSPGSFIHSSLAVFDSGTTRIPHVAFKDGLNGSKLTVMKFDGTWDFVGSAGATSGTVEYVSLALDSTGIPYVAFRDGEHSGKLTVLKYESSWESVGDLGFSPGGVSSVHLVISSNGIPFVAYKDEYNSNKATVMKFTSGAWSVVGAEGVSEGAADSVSMAMDGENTVYLAFKDGAQAGKATVLTWDGGSWKPVGSKAFTPGTADNVRLVLDSQGRPIVAYKDGANSGKASVRIFQ